MIRVHHYALHLKRRGCALAVDRTQRTGAFFIDNPYEVIPKVTIFYGFRSYLWGQETSHFLRELVPGLWRGEKLLPAFEGVAEGISGHRSIRQLLFEQFNRQVDRALFEPPDIPDISVLQSVWSQCEGNDFIGKDLFSALRPHNQPRCAKVNTIIVTQQGRLVVITGHPADIDIDTLSRYQVMIEPGLDLHFPGIDISFSYLSWFGYRDWQSIFAPQRLNESFSEIGQRITGKFGAAGKIKVFAEAA